MEDLKALKLQVVLLQAGCLMTSEGQSRVTSSEILFRARKQGDFDALPSTVGQLLGGLGLPTTTSKGRTRFLLDPEIIEPLIDDLESQIQTIAQRTRSLVQSVGNVLARLEPLEERFQQVNQQVQREKELQEFLNKHRPAWAQSKMLQFEANRLKEELAYQERLKGWIRQTEQRLESRPELEERGRTMGRRVKELEARKEELVKKEKALNREEVGIKVAVTKLTQGVALAKLNIEISRAQEELEELKVQINQNRSWLDRLLHGQEGAGS